MSLKTAINLAMIFGAMVCGGIFVTLASTGHGLGGLFIGALVGGVSGMIALGVLTVFLNKHDKALVHTQELQSPHMKVASVNQESAVPDVIEKNTEIELIFADGTRVTSQQFGYLSFRWSGQWAEQILAEFAPGKIAAAFPASSAITESPFTARLYLTIFHAAIHLSYVATVLRAPAQSIPYFLKGLNDALGNVSSPSGSALGEQVKEKMMESVAVFAYAIDQDLESAATRERGVFNPNNSTATDLLLDMLLTAYSSPMDCAPLAMYGIGHLFDDALPSVMTILKSNLGLRLVEDTQY